MRQDDALCFHPHTVAEETVAEEESEIKVTGSFPSDNPFGRTCPSFLSIRRP